MNALTFDTLKAARRLRDEYGFDERQAAGIVETFADGMSVSLDQLATKHDLALLRSELEALRKELKGDVDTLRKELRGDVETLGRTLRGEMREQDQRMTIRLGGMIVAAGGFFAVLDRLLT